MENNKIEIICNILSIVIDAIDMNDWDLKLLKKKKYRARLVHVFKNWKLLFKNIYKNTLGWKIMLKCVKYYLKTENGCLKIQTIHPHNDYV